MDVWFQCALVTRCITTKQKFNGHRLRELGRNSPTAIPPIVSVAQGLRDSIEMVLLKFCLIALFGRERLLQMAGDLTTDARDLIGFLFPCMRNTGQNIFEGWHVIALHGRKISSSVKRFEIRGQKD